MTSGAEEQAAPADAGTTEAGATEGARLRLRARDSEDLMVLSAHLQDAIVPISDMAYLGRDRSFVMVVNRFLWTRGSQPDKDTDHHLRTNSGVRFLGVTRVHARNINQRKRGQLLELLSVRHEVDAIHLTFAGGGEIRLEAAEIDAVLEDIDEPWPTRRLPSHRIDEE